MSKTASTLFPMYAQRLRRRNTGATYASEGLIHSCGDENGSVVAVTAYSHRSLVSPENVVQQDALGSIDIIRMTITLNKDSPSRVLKLPERALEFSWENWWTLVSLGLWNKPPGEQGL